jgi:hypothetical protein
VDEVHHLLAGTYREQRASLNLLKYLANDLQISMVVVGTRDAVLALQTDAQMLSRYTPFEIPRWHESDSLRRLLAAFERCYLCESLLIWLAARSYSLSLLLAAVSPERFRRF